MRVPFASGGPVPEWKPLREEPAQAPPMRILVADDNRDAADSLQRVLALFGHEVRVAYDGASAVRISGEFRPRVAILDLGMPGTDGYEARLGGTFHRWIEVYYPDRGYVFSDPLSSVNGVDARYVAFSRRAWTRPQNLALTSLFRTGDLSYVTRRAGDNTLRIRSIAPEASAR